jgi:hypothetical protein
MSPVLDKLAVRATRLTRLACFGVLVAVLAAIGPAASFAQSVPPSSSLDVPTTKLLTIGTFTAKGSPDRWKPLLPAEVRDTVRLYLAGKIDQWYLKQDQSGVVFMMNVSDPLGKFPFGQAGLMEFEIMPLGPIAPLRVLLADPPKIIRAAPHQSNERKHEMFDVKNPRVHAEILPALAAVVGPTTKILAIGSVTAKGTPEAIAPVLPHEVRATVRNHLAGKIEQWFFQTEGYGVVFIVNATSTAEAHELLEKLPLGVAGMMEFELIALGPLAPLAMLIGEPPRS